VRIYRENIEGKSISKTFLIKVIDERLMASKMNFSV
jgi:hypothetical protein